MTDNYWTRGLNRRRLIQGSIAGGAVLAAGGLAACGGRQSGSQGSASSAQGKPQSGGKVALNVNNDPFDWDLSYAGKTAPNGTGQALAYESLLGLNAGRRSPMAICSSHQNWQTSGKRPTPRRTPSTCTPTSNSPMQRPSMGER